MKRLLIILTAILLAGTLGCDIVKDGVKKKYYDSGQMMSVAHYKNFRKHGPYKEYFPDGSLKVEAEFLRGELHGAAKAYNEDGELILKEFYEHGEIMQRTNY